MFKNTSTHKVKIEFSYLDVDKHKTKKGSVDTKTEITLKHKTKGLPGGQWIRTPHFSTGVRFDPILRSHILH